MIYKSMYIHIYIYISSTRKYDTQLRKGETKGMEFSSSIRKFARKPTRGGNNKNNDDDDDDNNDDDNNNNNNNDNDNNNNRPWWMREHVMR